jgi:hypothetical protein
LRTTAFDGHGNCNFIYSKNLGDLARLEQSIKSGMTTRPVRRMFREDNGSAVRFDPRDRRIPRVAIFSTVRLLALHFMIRRRQIGGY